LKDWNGNLDLAYARDVWGKLVLEAEPKWLVKAKKKKSFERHFLTD
jgi:hypothetical protein